MSWAQQELATIDLDDARLNRRACLLLERWAQNPEGSIPQASQGWDEVQAAYRFFDNVKVDCEGVLAPHRACTLERIKQHSVVLNIQDTTELNFNGQNIAGLGPLNHESQRGMLLHPTYAITPDRLPLGIIDYWSWAREFKDETGHRGGENESLRWVEGYARVAQRALETPETRQVYIADRESDILPVLRKAQELEYAADFLIRCKYNRSLPEGKKLWEVADSSTVMGKVSFMLPRGRNRKARKIQQEIRVARIAIPDKQRGILEVTCIVASEVNVPAGVKPVLWRLLSNRLVSNLSEAVELVEWYRARWEVEMFFLILKEGCAVEKLQLDSRNKVETALVLYMIVSWRINYLMRVGRELPDLPADILFHRDEWHAAYILNEKHPPSSLPSANEVLRLIAQIGGFIGRKGDGEPGVKTIWKGLQQMSIFIAGMQYMRKMQSEAP